MDIINKFLAFENKNYFLKKNSKKKLARVFNIYFIPTSLNALPENNYSMKHDINYQKELIEKFGSNSISSFNTYPKILEKLVILFPDKNSHFNFLDFGGENIDFYLKLKNIIKI